MDQVLFVRRVSLEIIIKYYIHITIYSILGFQTITYVQNAGLSSRTLVFVFHMLSYIQTKTSLIFRIIRERAEFNCTV